MLSISNYRLAYVLGTARVESGRNAGLDHYWFFFFKPVSVHWLGGGATPTNESDNWSSNPVMCRGVAFVGLNANACFLRAAAQVTHSLEIRPRRLLSVAVAAPKKEDGRPAGSNFRFAVNTRMAEDGIPIRKS